MDTWQVTPGTGAQWTLTVTGEDSNPITTYLGSEVLTGSIRPGRAVAPVATLAPIWKDATHGLVSVPVPGLATAALAAGSYLVSVGLADSSADFFEGLLEVGYAPGDGHAPPDLLRPRRRPRLLRLDREALDAPRPDRIRPAAGPGPVLPG